MTKSVELRRHTDNDGDQLSSEGVAAAVEIGRKLDGDFDLVVSSGAHRATQTAACFLSGLEGKVATGVVVDTRFRSEFEDKWKEAYERAGAGDLASFRRAAPDLVDNESKLMGRALEDVFDRLPEGGRAMVVGHSPMQEAAVYGLTGEIVEPLSKGAGVLVVSEDDGTLRVEALG
ncbi:MAG: histidine phosphatase family protein [Actinomycetota bacterium]